MKKKLRDITFAFSFGLLGGDGKDSLPNIVHSAHANENSQITYTQQDLDMIHEKLMGHASRMNTDLLIQILNKQEQEILLAFRYSIQNQSEQSLSQKEKDLRYFSTLLNQRITQQERNQRFNQIRSQIRSFIQNHRLQSASLFMRNVRGANKATFTRDSLQGVDFTQINSNLAEQILRLSRDYDLHPRLVTTICVIENNFGLLRVSSSGARGMCQTKPELVSYYYSNYSSMNDVEKNWAHFVTTFRYLNDLKKKYNLAIGYNDGIMQSREDFMLAGLFYYNGESSAFNRENIIYEYNSKQYLLKLMSSYSIPLFKLGENALF